MKTALVRVLFVLLFFAITKIAVAGDFVSTVVQATQSLPTITVPGDHFLVIRNFTQEAGAVTRGSVSVTTGGLTTTVLTAAIVDPAAGPGTLEVINNIVIAGPATVTVTNPDTVTSCFITYRKGTD
jgi:hypothetical protein